MNHRDLVVQSKTPLGDQVAFLFELTLSMNGRIKNRSAVSALAL